MTATLTTHTLSESQPPRMEPLARLPVFFAMEGRHALVAGGTPGAAWKAELLSAAGAEVAVYAPETCDHIVALAIDPPHGAQRRSRWFECIRRPAGSCFSSASGRAGSWA